jgi:hypothetical protein
LLVYVFKGKNNVAFRGEKRTSHLGDGWEVDQTGQRFYVGGVLVGALGTGLSGTASIPSGGTSVVCSHSLGIVPRVLLEILSNLGGRSVWISGKSATQFTINISSSGGSSFSFGWQVAP